MSFCFFVFLVLRGKATTKKPKNQKKTVKIRNFPNQKTKKTNKSVRIVVILQIHNGAFGFLVFWYCEEATSLKKQTKTKKVEIISEFPNQKTKKPKKSARIVVIRQIHRGPFGFLVFWYCEKEPKQKKTKKKHYYGRTGV